MSDLISIYNTLQQDPSNKDMQRMFVRSVTPHEVAKLIDQLAVLKDKLSTVYHTGRSGIIYVGAANYPERATEALISLDIVYNNN